MSALIWLSFYSLFALSILDNFRGPFYPDILQDLSLGPAQGSWFFATMSCFASLGSWLLHGFLRRHSAVHLMGAAAFVVAIGFAGIAQAPSLALLLVSCAVFGFAFGGLNLAQNVLIGEAADGAIRRRLFSGLHAMYGLASLVAPLMASWFRDHGWSWRVAFLCSTTLPLILALWSWRLHKLAVPTHAEAAPPALEKKELWKSAFFALILAAYLWGELSVSSRLVLWLRVERGFAPDQADFYLALFFSCLLAGRLLFGFLNVERMGLGNRGLLLASAGLSAVGYALGLSYSPLFLVACGFVMAPFYPVMMDEVSRQFGRKTSQALGLVIGGGSGSVVLMHVLIGQLNARFGLTVALSLCAVSLAFLTLLLLGWSVRAHRQPN